MSDFVIQLHQREQQVHWDLMLKIGKSLATWQVFHPPSAWPQKKIECRHIFNHHLKYLTYQGALSNNRGHVQIVAAGQYQATEITENCWRVTLISDKINGLLELQHQQQDQWLMRFAGECVC